MKSMAWQATPTPVLDLLPSLLTTKTNRPLLTRLGRKVILMCSSAPWQPRPGRKPYETCLKRASRIGSRSCLTALCTTRSVTVGIPRVNWPPKNGHHKVCYF